MPDPTRDAPMTVALLKNLPFGVAPRAADRGDVALPYRIDHLVRAGIRLRYTDLPHRDPFRRAHDPSVQTARLLPTLLTSPVAFAMFESSAHPWGLLRHHLAPARRNGFAVMSCWLPELLAGAGPRQLDRYRKAYDSVDRLFYFSRNQTDLLTEVLQVPPEHLRPIEFGIDIDELPPCAPAPEGPLVAVGRDRGRDWPTLLAALGATGLPARIVCRPGDIRGLAVPANVEVLGPVDRAEYRRHLAEAKAVLVVTHVLGYPTGQSVLLEAMASARACVVTDTPAMRDYVVPGRTALPVPPHDPEALAEVLMSIDRDEQPLADIGLAARHAVERVFTAERMWQTVAVELRSLAEAR